MAAIPNWLVGRHVTTLTLTPLSVDTGGNITEVTASACAFYGVLNEVNFESRVVTENISPMDSMQENNVVIEYGSTLRLGEIMKRTGSNLGAFLAFNYMYVKYVLARGAQSYTGYGVIGNYSEDLTKQRGNANLEIQPIAVISASGTLSYVSNPVYS